MAEISDFLQLVREERTKYFGIRTHEKGRILNLVDLRYTEKFDPSGKLVATELMLRNNNDHNFHFHDAYVTHETGKSIEMCVIDSSSGKKVGESVLSEIREFYKPDMADSLIKKIGIVLASQNTCAKVLWDYALKNR